MQSIPDMTMLILFKIPFVMSYQKQLQLSILKHLSFYSTQDELEHWT